MRKVIYSPMVSLDGFVEGPNRELDWGIIDEELHTYINQQHGAIDTYLFGRRMYEVMLYWKQPIVTARTRNMSSNSRASGRTYTRSCSRRRSSRSRAMPC
jgi:dihydrofolate reductase